VKTTKRLLDEKTFPVVQKSKTAGILVGFADEDDWFEYRLEHDPRFLKRIEEARQSLHAGRGVKLEDIEP